MKFLVTTHSYLLFVTINEALELEDVQVIDADRFYGADIIPKQRIIACKFNSPWSKVSTTGIRFYDFSGNTLDDYPEWSEHGLSIFDIHQATYGHNGVWFTNTARNCLSHINFYNKKTDFYIGAGEFDLNHINSIDIVNDVLYVAFHNLARCPSEIHRYRYSLVKAYYEDVIDGPDLEHLDFQVLPHWSIHNVMTSEHGYATTPETRLYYNASDNGSVMRGVWGSDDYDSILLGEQWHPKGMCQTKEYIVSGFSEHAVDTPRRFISESGLAFINKETWELVAMPRIELDGVWVGNVNEARLLSE